MPIYKVTGTDGYTGETRELYVDAPDDRQAVGFAAGRGVLNATAEQAAPQVIPRGTPVLKAAGWRPTDPSATPPINAGAPQQYSELLTRPVITIAKGVFLGVFLVWLAVLAIGLVLSLAGYGLQFMR